MRNSEGLIASADEPRMVTSQFERTLASKDYREGASRFAAHYVDFDPQLQIQKLVDRVEWLLPAV